MADYPPPQQPGTPDPNVGQLPPTQPGYAPPGQPAYGQPAPGQPAPGQPPYGQPAYGGGGYQRGPKTNVLAIISLVAALGGIFLACGFGGLASIPLGIVALGQIKKSNGAETGRGLAIGGIVAGAVILLASLALWLSLVVLADNVDDTLDEICNEDTNGDGIDDCGFDVDDFTTSTLG